MLFVSIMDIYLMMQESPRNKMREVLPTLAVEAVDNVVAARIDGCGVECTAELEFVVESDLLGLLKPVQARKLLKI
jgi:hypothetical protein